MSSTLPFHDFSLPTPPSIRIQRASPGFDSDLEAPCFVGELNGCVCADHHHPQQKKPLGLVRSNKRKSSTEPDTSYMMPTPSSSGIGSPSSVASPESPRALDKPRSRAKRSRVTLQETNWADVSDPEERRRIQNRVAQRKFRQKAKDNKEKEDREAKNREHAGNSYRIPTAEDFAWNTEPCGLPWGGLNFGLAITQGHELESRRSSGRATTTYMGDESIPRSSRSSCSAGSSSSGSSSMMMKHNHQPVPELCTWPPQTLSPQTYSSYESSIPGESYVPDVHYPFNPFLQGYGGLAP